MLYKIKWRNRKNFIVVVGLSSYLTLELAERQKRFLKEYFQILHIILSGGKEN